MSETEGKLFDYLEKNRSNLDNALLRISSLGIPLSIAFKEDVFGSCYDYQWLFIGFIVSWVITVVGVVGSFCTSDLAVKAMLDKKKRPWLMFSKILNTVNVLSFLIGIGFVCLYAIYNA